MCRAGRGVLGEGRTRRGAKASKHMSIRYPDSGWSRGPGTLPSDPPCREHRGKTTIPGHSGGKTREKDISSLVRGGEAENEKGSATPWKGPKCDLAKGGCLFQIRVCTLSSPPPCKAIQ